MAETLFLDMVMQGYFCDHARLMKILVVDDEQDVQVLFEQRFQKEIKNREVEFAFAYSGKEALHYLSGQDHQPVLILSDINMPGISGLELPLDFSQLEGKLKAIAE